MTIDLKEIDELDAKGDFQSCVTKLKPALEREPQNPELLWRLARTTHQLLHAMEKKNPARKPLVLEAHKYALAALALSPADFHVLKWSAVTTGSVCDVSDNKERIKLGFEFKKLLDQALALDAKDSTLLHMRGRFEFTIANLSWLERKTATALFATPPTANIDDALKDFLEVLKLRPDWAENLLYLGLSYLSKKDLPNAQLYLKKAAEIHSADPTETEAAHEAKKHLKSLPK